MAAACLSLAGCDSIREDRVPCPCWLTVHFDELQGGNSIPEKVGQKLCGTLFYGSEGLEKTQDIDLSEDESPKYIQVDKEETVVAALLGRNLNAIYSTDVIVTKGEQADSLYAFSTKVDCTGDAAEVQLNIFKQFTTVNVNFANGMPPSDFMHKYNIVARSNSNGLDVTTMTPKRGEFEFWINKVDSDGTFRFNILRQYDNSISLTVYERETGWPVMQMPIGKLIDEQNIGYDWDGQSLQDIWVVFDVFDATVGISVEDWEDAWRKIVRL